MPNVYQVLQNKLPVFLKPSELKTKVPGQIIAGDPSVRDFPTLFQAFCKYFRTGGHWIWNGGSVTPSSGSILDGARNQGQCLALANALRFLALQPKPFGLGINEGELGEPSTDAGGLFKGQFGFGFVSEHSDLTSRGSVLGLQSNVFQAPNPATHLTLVSMATPRSGLYLWENHKTVSYLGRYYDPSYGRIWDNKPQMAKFHIKVANPLQRVETTPAGKQETTLYYPASGGGGDVYFRSLLPAEAQATNCNGYQGPFAALPGQEWVGPSVSGIKQMVFNKKN
jgi:hypothetical protein